MANEVTRVVLEGKGPKHKVGDEVTWQSQANGSVTTKTGVIVEILKPGAEASPRVSAHETAAGNMYSSGRDRTGGGFVHARYLVKVPRMGARGALPPLWYSPLVSVIDRATR